MPDGMNSVLQRIDEIQKRINDIKKIKTNESNNSQQTDQASKTSFDETLKKSMTDESVTEINSNNYSRENINKIASEYAIKSGIPPSLVDAVIQVESNYNPKAVSPKGAMGLMQLMPAVSKELGIENPFDVQENIQGGVSILKNLINKYDWDLKKALAAYNAGESAVDRNNGIPPYKETGDYVKKVLNTFFDNIE